MSWFPLEETITDHPKILQAGHKGFALYVAGLCYASKHLTNGFIPMTAVSLLLPDLRAQVAKVAAGLVNAGLWEETSGGYQVHDYLDYQRSREQVEARRREGAARQRKLQDKRRPAVSNAVTNNQGAAVTNGRDDDVTNSQDDRVTNDQGDRVTNDQGDDVTNSQAADVTNGQDDRVTNSQGDGVTNALVTLLENSRGEKSREEKNTEPTTTLAGVGKSETGDTHNDGLVGSIFLILSKIPGWSEHDPGRDVAAAWLDAVGAGPDHAVTAATALTAQWDGRNDNPWATYQSWVLKGPRPKPGGEEGGIAGEHLDPYIAEEQRIQSRRDARARGEL